MADSKAAEVKVSRLEVALAAEQVAAEQEHAKQEAHAEAVRHWDEVYGDLVEIKRAVEHVEASPVRSSRLWRALQGVDIAEWDEHQAALEAQAKESKGKKEKAE